MCEIKPTCVPYTKSKILGRATSITDGRFSGEHRTSVCISPEAAAGGEIALIHNGDIIEIDVKTRKIDVSLTDEELEIRRKEEKLKGEYAFSPEARKREIPSSLKAYAKMVSSADRGAVRII